MELPDRHMLLGMTLGALCATVLAMTGPGMVIETFAEDLINGDEVVAPGFDPSKLVIFEDNVFHVEHEDWVATEPLATHRVKKVEAGKVSYVTITETETGTYSTDAMFSDHVQYPGIEVEKLASLPRNRFFFWDGSGWHSFRSSLGNSFYHFRSGDTRITQWGNTTCVSGRNYSVC
jgi:hypothetical protein